MAAVREGVERVLNAYNPFPCVVVDRGWQIVHANAGAGVLLEGVAPHLLERPNALRIAVHPEGLAPRSAISGNGAITSSSGFGVRPRSAARASCPRCLLRSRRIQGVSRRHAISAASRCRSSCTPPMDSC